jgi:hypothetical protein
VAVVASLVSPVFAQPANSGFGPDNMVGSSYGPDARQHRTTAHKSGPHYYAMVSGTLSASNPNSAAETGGGSLGYNETLLRD